MKFIMFLVLASLINATTITVVSTDMAAIQRANNMSASGDTIVFPAGTYNLTVNFPALPNRIYQGQPGAIIKASLGAPLFMGASNMTVDGFVFDGGGIAFANLADAVKITNNTFQNIIIQNPYSMNGITAQGGMSNSSINNNKFTNIWQTGRVNGWSDVCGAIWIWDPINVAIANNTFDKICQAIHVTANKNDQDLFITGNTITNNARYNIEIQGNFGINNVQVTNNNISALTPNINGQAGISVAVGGTGHQVLNNVLLGPNVGHPNTWQSDAIELMGAAFLIQGNQGGNWQTAQLIGWSDNKWTTQNNVWCGMTDPNGRSIIYLEDHGQAPGTNQGNTITAICPTPFPPTVPPVIIQPPVIVPPTVVPLNAVCTGTVPGTLTCVVQ